MPKGQKSSYVIRKPYLPLKMRLIFANTNWVRIHDRVDFILMHTFFLYVYCSWTHFRWNGSHPDQGTLLLGYKAIVSFNLTVQLVAIKHQSHKLCLTKIDHTMPDLVT